MSENSNLYDHVILQPIEPGMTVPSKISAKALFLLNLQEFVEFDVWDNPGWQIEQQARRLRELTSCLTKIADLLDDLGGHLAGIPDAYDFDPSEYDQTWEEMNTEADEMINKSYSQIQATIDELTQLAADDFWG